MNGIRTANRASRRDVAAARSCSPPPRRRARPPARRRKAARSSSASRHGEPDALDPTLARTFSGREVFLTFCEKLYDLNAKAQIVPQLASALPTISKDKLTVTIPLRKGIKFNDGTPFNADAVVKTLQRDQTLKGSTRASEISPIDTVTASGAEHGRHPPEDPLLAADRAVRRPRGDDHVAGAARQARRQVRDRPGLRRAVHLRQPRRGRQHHGRRSRRSTTTRRTSISTRSSSRSRTTRPPRQLR